MFQCATAEIKHCFISILFQLCGQYNCTRCVLLHLRVGPIPLFIGSEMFRQGPRPKAMAVVGVSLWVSTFVIAMGFESLQVSRLLAHRDAHDEIFYFEMLKRN